MPEIDPWKPKVGDVVQLKSGGPRMTVTDTKPPFTRYVDETDTRIVCGWFTKTQEYIGSEFYPETLIPVSSGIIYRGDENDPQ
jgi:uncharacterized protein YodC (DUF2158 family)